MTGENRKFLPPSELWQQKTCTKLNLPFKATPCMYGSPNQFLSEPTQVYKVKGDGNCFFRALSVAVTGCEENHGLLRSMIVSYIKSENSLVLGGIIQNITRDQYIKRSCMEVNGTWATEVEIFVASALLDAPIYVFSKFGASYKWLEFKPSDTRIHDAHSSSTSADALYLYHKSGDHYDLVLAVEGEKSREGYPGKHHSKMAVPDDSRCESTEDQLGISLHEEQSSFQENGNIQDSLGVSLQDNDELGLSVEEILDTAEGGDDIQEDFNFKCKEQSALPLKGHRRKDHSEDIFDFDTEDDDKLTYNDFKRKNKDLLKTSTPKKPKLLNFVASLDTTFKADSSVYDSSFEAEFDEFKDHKSLHKPAKCSKMLQKAMETTSTAIKIGRECNFGCLRGINEEKIKKARNNYWTKTEKNRLEWFFDKVAESRKKQNQIQFSIEGGKYVCSNCFRTLHMISKSSFFRKMQMYKSGATSAGLRKGREDSKTKEEALRWLKEYAYYHTDRMPDSGDLMLPYKTRKSTIYNMYHDEKIENMEYSISSSAFYEMWRKDCPKLKIKQTNSFSKCSTCVSIERELERTRNPEKRAKLMKMMAVHNARQMRERRHYYEKREKAKRHPKKNMSLIIDGMDQSKTDLPHFCGRMQKGIDPTGMLKTHIQGVLNHGKGTMTTYVDMNEYSHDGNLVMNILLKSIADAVDKNGNLPDILFIQADNCARENKNKFILAFCDLLVRLHIFHEVNLSFLYVGHTHEDIDAKFSQIAEKLRKEDVATLPRLLEVIGGRLLKGLFDIKSWLLPNINNIEGHSKPLHFQFCNDDKTVVLKYRANSEKPWITSDTPVLSNLPSGTPDILQPPNMKNIDVKSILKNVEKLRFEMSEGQFKWWKRLLAEISDTASSNAKLNEYAKREAVWLLPLLQNKALNRTDEEVPLSGHIENLMDKELDDHAVNIVPKKAPKKSSNNQKAKKKTGQGRQPAKKL